MKKVTWYEDLYNEVKNDSDFKAMKAVEETIFRLCARMNELGMSQRELAKKLGVTQPYISKVLNRGQNITFQTLYTFADALGLSVRPPKLVAKEEIQKKKKDSALKLIKNVYGCDFQEQSEAFTGSEEFCDDECINAAC